MELLIIWLFGLFFTGTVVTVLQKITPPTWLTRGSYTDHEGWLIHAATRLGRFGQLWICPFCLAVHVSFWVGLILALGHAETLSEGCLLVLGAVGWAYIILKNEKPVHMDQVSDRGSPEEAEDPEVPQEDQDVRIAKAGKVVGPHSVEAKLKFMRERGIKGTIDPKTGNVLVESVDPVHEKVQALFRRQNPSPCFFEGCDDMMKPYKKKLAEFEDGGCKSCDLGAMQKELYPKLVEAARSAEEGEDKGEPEKSGE